MPELTWILFLRILDEREQHEAEYAEAVGAEFTPSFPPPYRWRDWAAPEAGKRKALQQGTLRAYFSFVNGELLPYLRDLKNHPNATPRQKLISEIMSGVERVRIDTERNFLDVLGRVNGISAETVDNTHIFTLSHFEDFFARLPGRQDSERSWTVERPALEQKGYDLKAVNPNAKVEADTRTPEEILDLIEVKQKEIAEAIARLRAIG